jgi:tetratricopeptide (TPR) repeat protein
MNALGLSALAIALAAGTSFVTTLALAPQPPEQDAGATSAEELSALQLELQSLRTQLAQLQAEQGAEELRAAPSASTQRLAVGDIRAEVERLFAERWEAAMLEGVALPSSATLAESPARSADDFLALLLESGIDPESSQALWDEAREAGQLDALIAMFEARAEENKNDPDAQLDVGHAYLQKIFEVGDGPAAGLWAGKADASFDRALAIDDHHWQARSSKAVSLSFWPPIFGKQKESIQHFEILVAQQEAGGLEDKHSQTYLLLGNLYHQTGQGEKATAIWQQGLANFPDDEALQGQLGGGGQ